MSVLWSFEEHSKKAIKRDPFEAEFFTGEEEDEAAFGRTDSLVRETIQNSLDAQNPEHKGPIELRFAIRKGKHAIVASTAKQFLGDLAPHLNALNNDVISQTFGQSSIPYLVIEDFGTRGLRGDPNWDSLELTKEGREQDFFWFWRNVGRSGKGGTNLGRWGLGKTVFQATSAINTIFGLTVRAFDGRKLLMGQAITKIHAIGEKNFVPEGFFCDPKKSGDLQMPFEGSDVLTDFEKSFDVQRGNKSGLSIVIPFPSDRLKAKEIARSVIVHFFIPILKNRLVVRISETGEPDVEISAESIRTESAKFQWKVKKLDRNRPQPPFELAEWALKSQKDGSLTTIVGHTDKGMPQWAEKIFATGQLEALRNRFDSGERIAVRVPLSLERKDGNLENTFFDVFIERDADLPRSEDHFVRDGMTISDISTLSGPGIRGLLMVDDAKLSALLGDAEGPAHTKWETGEARPDLSYKVSWKRRVTFVRNGIVKLLDLLAKPPEDLSEDWLMDIFSLEDPSKPGPKDKKSLKRKKKQEDPPPVPDPKVESERKSFSIIDLADGFRIKGSSEGKLPKAITVRVAYDIPSGNPFSESHYSPLDFRFDKQSTEGPKIAFNGLEIKTKGTNSLEIEPKVSDFELQVTGFDVNRDVVVRTTSITEEEGE